MPAGPDFMRPLRAGEEDMAEALLKAAFLSPAEAALVRALRAAGQMELEMVLPWGTGLAGYLALSRLTAPADWLALAPVAIAPDWQGQRWGTRFVTGVARLAAIKGQTLVVLGKPSFYTRCGFSHPRAARLTSPYGTDHTLIARPGDDSPDATLIYPAAFQGL
jgi:putative acetyltransferase